MGTTGSERDMHVDSYFHGWLYRTFIDPAMVPIRELVREWVPSGSSVVDMGCGTGAQLFALRDRIVRGLGIDSSPAQINQAIRRAARLQCEHIDFWTSDATRLESIRDGEFDIAMTSMVIHEMPEDIRIPVLTEMRRIARQLVLVDWQVPQPNLLHKFGTHFIERFAGTEHYRGFRSFNASGGMPALLVRTGLTVLDEQGTGKGTMRLWRCRSDKDQRTIPAEEP